jgi:hypothetical protein
MIKETLEKIESLLLYEDMKEVCGSQAEIGLPRS